MTRIGRHQYLANTTDGGFRRRVPATPLVLTSTLGIAMALGFSVSLLAGVLAWGPLLRPLPVVDEASLFVALEVSPREGAASGTAGVSPTTFRFWREHATTATFAYVSRTSTDQFLSVGGRAQIVSAAYADPAINSVLRPMRDTTARLPVNSWVLEAEMWRDAPRDSEGRTEVRLEGISGQASTATLSHPRRFLPADADAWWILEASEGERWHNSRAYVVIGRMNPGTNLGAVRAELSMLSEELGRTLPDSHKDWRPHVEPLRDILTAESRPLAWVLLGAAVAMFLLTLVGTAQVLVSRHASERRINGIKQMLGASSARIVIDAIKMPVAAVFIAASVSALAIVQVLNALPTLLPDPLEVDSFGSITPAFLMLWSGVFLFMTSTSATLAYRQASGAAVSRLLRPSRTLRWLTAVQIATVLALSVVSVAFALELHRRNQIDWGFRSDNLVSATIRHPIGLDPDTVRHYPTVRFAAETRLLVDSLIEHPGALVVSGSSEPPLSGSGRRVEIHRRPSPVGGAWLPTGATDLSQEPNATARRHNILPDFFKAIGATLSSGREFTRDDRLSEDVLDNQTDVRPVGVAIVNERLAQELWPDGLALGQTISIDRGRWQRSHRVVGIVKDHRYSGPAGGEPTVYVPYFAEPVYGLTLAVSAREGDARGVEQALRVAVEQRGGRVGLGSTHDVATLVAKESSAERFAATFASALAMAGLGVLFLGVLSLMRMLADASTRDAAIRLAVGATRVQVVMALLRQIGPVLVLGIGVGAAGGEFMTRLFTSVWIGWPDPPAEAVWIAIGVIIACLVAACSRPIARISNTSPTQLLRHH